MVKYSMSVEIEYPELLQIGNYNLQKVVEGILKNNMKLLQESKDGYDILPTGVQVTWLNGWMQSYKEEAQYQFEEGYMYAEGDPGYNVELTEEDYEEIADDICNNDWLNEQIGSVVREAVHEYVQKKLEDSDNNE